MTNLDPFVQAAIRAVIAAFIIAGGTFFGSMQLGDVTPLQGFWAAGSAFCLTLGTRLGIEGVIDQRAHFRAQQPPVIGDREL